MQKLAVLFLLCCWLLDRVLSDSSCKRSDRGLPSPCATACVPSSGCSQPSHACLCDGECGYSCVHKGLSCGIPPPVRDASVRFSGTGFNATAVYTCKPGFTVIGSLIKRCTARGKWSGAMPSCMQACQILDDLPYGAFVRKPKPQGAVYVTGEKLHLGCKPGFKQRGNAVRICIGGRWTNFPFTCIGTHACRRTIRAAFTRCTKKCYPTGKSDCPSNSKCLCDGRCGYSCVENGLSCGIPPAPDNGYLFFNGTGYNDTVRYKCDQNYTLFGNPVRRCTAKKVWEGMPTTCLRDCNNPPPIPRNAYIEGLKDRHASGDRLMLKCKPGFKQDGLATTTCFLGSWTISPFRCKQSGCGKPGVPKNGRRIGIKFSVRDTVYFTCNHGYVLKGSAKRTCGRDFRWTGTQPYCTDVQCSPMTPPLHGSIIGKGSAYRTILRFTCDPGYELRGRNRSICESSGQWSITPRCNPIDCGFLETPLNGKLEGNVTTYRSVIRVTCEKDFVLIGSRSRVCQADGTWSGKRFSCKPVNCGRLAPPADGGIVGNSTIYKSVIEITCEKGFNLIGSKSRACQADGTWSGQESTCKVVNCGGLKPPKNGEITGDSTTYNSVIKVACDKGFNLIGWQSRACQADGTWSGQEGTCKVVNCGGLKPPKNGQTTGDSTTYNSVIKITCDKGFNLIGSQSRACQADGTWSGQESTCKVVNCGALKPPKNGRITGNSTTYSSVLKVTCDKGFNLIGSKSRVCQEDGTWSGQEGTCNVVNCGVLKSPKNGRIEGDSTTYNSVIKVTCDKGFNLIGPQSRECQADGTWSGQEGTCNVVNCGALKPPQNGRITGDSTTYNSVIKIACDKGFNLIGSKSRVCQADGTWSRQEGTCQVVNCGALKPPKSGRITGDSTTYNSVLKVTCDKGFNLIGPQSRACQADGTWSGRKGTCKVVDCGQAKPPANGKLEGSSTSYNSMVKVTCDKGFVLIGSQSRVCQANGTWSGGTITCAGEIAGGLKDCKRSPNAVLPECSLKCKRDQDCPPKHQCRCDGLCGPGCVEIGLVCLEPPALANGDGRFNGTAYNNTVLYTCDKGHSLFGNPVRRCTAKKTWSRTPPKCLPDCLPSDISRHALIVNPKPKYKTGDRAFLTCRRGYMSVDGEKNRVSAHCIMGVWNNSLECQAIDCGPFHVPLHGTVDAWSTTYGSTTKFACEEGYKLKGSKTRRCQSDGTWSGNKTLCHATHCKRPPFPLNSKPLSSLKGRYNLGDVFQYGCKPGFTLKGNPKRTCIQGIWTAASFLCEAVNCGNPGVPRHGTRTGAHFTFGNFLSFRCHGEGYVPRGALRIRCESTARWSAKPLHCIYCKEPLIRNKNKLVKPILSASSERDDHHTANFGRLDSDNAWCSARSEFAKYFQVDFGQHVEITGVATQGHPSEYKWLDHYKLRHTMGSYWFTYKENSKIKIFRGNRNRNVVVRHELKESIIASKIRIYRHEDIRGFRGSTVCLRAEFYGCPFYTSCITRGAPVYARWYKDGKQTYYVRGFVTELSDHVIKVVPADKHRSFVHSKPLTLNTRDSAAIIPDVLSSRWELERGSRIITTAHAAEGQVFAAGRIYYVMVASRIRVRLDDGQSVWRDIREIRRIIDPRYCVAQK